MSKFRSKSEWDGGVLYQIKIRSNKKDDFEIDTIV